MDILFQCFHDLLDISLSMFSLNYLYLSSHLPICLSVYLSNYQQTLRFSRLGKQSCESLFLADIRYKINTELSFVHVGSDLSPSTFSWHADIIISHEHEWMQGIKLQKLPSKWFALLQGLERKMMFLKDIMQENPWVKTSSKSENQV